MEIVIALGVVALVVWLITRGRQKSPAPRPPSCEWVANQTSTIAPTTNTTGYPPRSASADECWIPPGREVTIAGYRIPDGMVYLGKRLASVAGDGGEASRIDPSVPTKRTNLCRARGG